VGRRLRSTRVTTNLQRATAVPAPSLTREDPPARPRGVALMLHGGKESSTTPVDGRSASWRRSAAMQRSIAPRLRTDGIATWLLRYRRRGWNGGAGPVADARWALGEVRRELGDVPVVLVGHSMGGRTAVHVADDPSVVGVVALAPWLPAGEDVAAVTGTPLLAVHGRRDHVTSPRATRAYVERLAATGTRAAFLDMGPVGHYMFRRAAAWNDVAASRALAALDPL
jgi:pimeloyl-ACP methyl ester carboxylesterase